MKAKYYLILGSLLLVGGIVGLHISVESKPLVGSIVFLVCGLCGLLYAKILQLEKRIIALEEEARLALRGESAIKDPRTSGLTGRSDGK